MKIRTAFVSNSSSSSFVITKQIDNSMCNQVSSVNLQTAVLMQVQEFVNSGQTFSRYDITKALRQKCNDGVLEIPECEQLGATYRFNIVKSDVDTIFEQLYSNCLTNGLPPLCYDFQRDPNTGVGYRVFMVDQSALASMPTNTPVATTPVLAQTVSQPTSYVPCPVPTATAPVAPLSDSEINRRVTLYMTRCTQTGVVPTLKQIQSAIKRGNKSTGLSYSEIAKVATSLGYVV